MALCNLAVATDDVLDEIELDRLRVMARTVLMRRT
jgi:hypothetical protein